MAPSLKIAINTSVFMVLLVIACSSHSVRTKEISRRKETIKQTDGLIAFWDFESMKQNLWVSNHGDEDSERSFPVYLRRIGDTINYSISDWPYSDADSKLTKDFSGPLGAAIRFNKGYIYGSIPRDLFDNTQLDLKGKQAFTLIAWVKFIGDRHLVTGIWDEGGWHKYAGRRQAALFAGLFNQKGVIAHVSMTGAASFPQSEIDGAQYARVRAIDPQAFANDQWIAMAMTFDPGHQQVKAYFNGKMTPFKLSDPVTQDVYQHIEVQDANPLHFAGPIYSPRQFPIKFNGFDLREDGIREHRLWVDLVEANLYYEREGFLKEQSLTKYRITFDILRANSSILEKPIILSALTGDSVKFASRSMLENNDVIKTALQVQRENQWNHVGTEIEYIITEGAPFTFGRALGLASEEIEHGSQLFIDGVAVFNRVLSEKELIGLSFE